MTKKLYVCVDASGNGAGSLVVGDVYEGDTADAVPEYIRVSTKVEPRGQWYGTRFRPATLDDAYNTTHWLDGSTTPNTSRHPAGAILPKVPTVSKAVAPLDTQVGGDHYKNCPIQPIEYATKNKLGPCEFNVVKYVTRHGNKGGRQDLEKAKHMIDLLIQMEYPD